ncbi:MAG: hypothetical protein ACXVLQ_14400 [Bacteriovorax sp.]
MKIIATLALLLNGTMALAHLDDRAVEQEVAAHTKELTKAALKNAKSLLDKKTCEAGNNGPEDKAQPVYKIQMLEGSFQGLYRYNTKTQESIATFLVLKTCPSGATQHLGDLTLEFGALVKGTATFNNKDKLIDLKINKIKEVDNSLIKSLTEFQLYE